MADLLNLGSLLPTTYTAPDVSSILGGELGDAVCNEGTTVNSNCKSGGHPDSFCNNGTDP